MNTGIFAGSFDPITLGHLNIIKRMTSVFESGIILVGNNISKKYMFPTDKRIQMIEEVIKDNDIKNVKVEVLSTSLVDYIDFNKINNPFIVKGIRNVVDYTYECEMAHINREISKKNVETIFLQSNTEHMFISSSRVKELYYLNKEISSFVPKSVVKHFKREG